MYNLITVKDLMQRYGIGTKKAYEMIRIKGFPVLKMGNRNLIREDLLYTWEETHTGYSGINLPRQ